VTIHWSNLAAAAGVAFVLVLSGPAAGADRWLTFERSARCSTRLEALAARISSALAGVRNPGLTVEVEMVDARHGTTARMRLARGGRELGAKHIEATSCEEALDAVVAIAALALGSEAPLGAPAAGLSSDETAPRATALRAPERAAAGRLSPPPEAAPSAGGAASDGGVAWGGASSSDSARSRGFASSSDDAHSRGFASSPGLAASPNVATLEAVDRGTELTERESSASSWRWRWLLGAGIDRGALAAPTATLGVGMAAGSGRDELRGMLEYGLPSSDERGETGAGYARSRADFLGASVRYCRGLDADAWLSLCAGSEARVTRSSRFETGVDQPRSERGTLEPVALAVGGASLVYRPATWQPRFDVSALLPVLGDAAGTAAFGARAAVGASLPF
jgi:hypothetical protein